MAYKILDQNGRPARFKGHSNIIGMDNHTDFEVRDFSDKERSFLAVASVESEDRFKDIITQKGWKLENYRKNPAVMAFHDYRALPVGRSLEEFIATRKGVKALMFRPQFAPYSDYERMYEMYRDGYLKGFSVGFIPIKSEPIEAEEKDEDAIIFHQPTRFIEQELLENSVAPIPAHPDALAEVKSLVKRNFLPESILRLNDEEIVILDDEELNIPVTKNVLKTMINLEVKRQLRKRK